MQFFNQMVAVLVLFYSNWISISYLDSSDSLNLILTELVSSEHLLRQKMGYYTVYVSHLEFLTTNYV